MSPSLHPEECTHTRSETEPRETCEQDDRANALDDSPLLGKLYDAGGGRRLMLHHAGTGTPALVDRSQWRAEVLVACCEALSDPRRRLVHGTDSGWLDLSASNLQT